MISSISGLCPSRCNCDDSKLAVHCTDASLDLVPITLNPSLSELYLNRNIIKSIASSFTFYRKLQLLDLSENSITSLGSNNFHSQNILQVLLINKNKLTHVKRDTFHGLTALTILSLADNFIDTIDEHSFSSLKNLEKLDLSKNSLKMIANHAFFGLVNVKVLHLNRNSLSSLHNDALDIVKNVSLLDVSFNLIDSTDLRIPSLPFLSELNLAGNKITHLFNYTFVNVRESLLMVNLASNLLTSVPSESLSILNNLQHLVLSGNRIAHLTANCLTGCEKLQSFTLTNDDTLKRIDASAFASNSLLHSVSIDWCHALHSIESGTFIYQRETLTSLSLRENGLSRLPVDLVDWQTLERLDIRGNPFDCSCDNMWLANVINKQVNVSIERDHLKDILCSQPGELRGHQVSSITPDQINCVIDSNTIGTSYSFFSSSSTIDGNNRTLLGNGDSNWLATTAVPTWREKKTSRLLIVPVSIVLAVSLAAALAYFAWLLFRRNRQKRLAEKRIKQFLTVNINNFHPSNGNRLSPRHDTQSQCDDVTSGLLINKNYHSHSHCNSDTNGKYYSSINRSSDNYNTSLHASSSIVNPFECMNLYESPIYHEITSTPATSIHPACSSLSSSSPSSNSPAHRTSPANQQQSVPLISSSTFHSATFIDTRDERSRKCKNNLLSLSNNRNNCSSSSSSSSSPGFNGSGRLQFSHLSPHSNCSRDSRESVISNCTLVSGNSSGATAASASPSLIANTNPYAASFVIQHPIKLDSNLYRV